MVSSGNNHRPIVELHAVTDWRRINIVCSKNSAWMAALIEHSIALNHVPNRRPTRRNRKRGIKREEFSSTLGSAEDDDVGLTGERRLLRPWVDAELSDGADLGRRLRHCYGSVASFWSATYRSCPLCQ